MIMKIYLLSGFTLRLSPHSDAVLHLRYHRYAGMNPLPITSISRKVPMNSSIKCIFGGCAEGWRIEVTRSFKQLIENKI